jgi:hypothetical protein
LGQWHLYREVEVEPVHQALMHTWDFPMSLGLHWVWPGLFKSLSQPGDVFIGFLLFHW